VATLPSSKDKLLDLIRDNPFVSQQELAERIGLTRSAVASHLAQLIRDGRLLGRAYLLPGVEPILVAGGANLDRIAKGLGLAVMGTSNPVATKESYGGVARNVAENLARLGLPVRLMTAVGDDPPGAALLKHARDLGIDTGATLIEADCPTGTYTALLQPDGELVLALADMGVMDRFTVEALRQRRGHWASTRFRVLDCNLPAEVFAVLLEDSRRQGATLVIVAVSEPKMTRLPESLEGVSALILNQGELAARVGRALLDRQALIAACRQVLDQGAQGVVVTLGGEGVLCARGTEAPRHFPAPAAEIVDVTGAGDAFSAGFIASLTRYPEALFRACLVGQRLAALTLGSRSSVAATITPALLQELELLLIP
jgi:pseudouridine kinase